MNVSYFTRSSLKPYAATPVEGMEKKISYYNVKYVIVYFKIDINVALIMSLLQYCYRHFPEDIILYMWERPLLSIFQITSFLHPPPPQTLQPHLLLTATVGTIILQYLITYIVRSLNNNTAALSVSIVV